MHSISLFNSGGNFKDASRATCEVSNLPSLQGFAVCPNFFSQEPMGETGDQLSFSCLDYEPRQRHKKAHPILFPELTPTSFKFVQSTNTSGTNRTLRESLMEGGIAPVETSRTQGVDNSGLVNLQRQIMKEQDEDLESLERKFHSNKHIALAVNEELDLHTRLLATQKRLGFLNKNLGQGWSLMTMVFFIIVVVVLVLFLFKLL